MKNPPDVGRVDLPGGARVEWQVEERGREKVCQVALRTPGNLQFTVADDDYTKASYSVRPLQ